MSRFAAHLNTLLFVIEGRMSTVRENKERGATAVEYGLVVGLIAIAIIVAVTLLGTNLSTMFTTIAGKLKVT